MSDAAPKPPSGSDLIAAERRRQMGAEGWTPEHDDEHSQGELAWAAVCYAAPKPVRIWAKVPKRTGQRAEIGGEAFLPQVRRLVDPWPWDEQWDKRGSHDRIRALTIAGALIAAEIDRLQRKEPAHA